MDLAKGIEKVELQDAVLVDMGNAAAQEVQQPVAEQVQQPVEEEEQYAVYIQLEETKEVIRIPGKVAVLSSVLKDFASPTNIGEDTEFVFPLQSTNMKPFDSETAHTLLEFYQLYQEVWEIADKEKFEWISLPNQAKDWFNSKPQSLVLQVGNMAQYLGLEALLHYTANYSSMKVGNMMLSPAEQHKRNTTVNEDYTGLFGQ